MLGSESNSLEVNKVSNFTKGEGLEKTLKKLGYECNLDMSKKKIVIFSTICFMISNFSNGGIENSFLNPRPDNIRKKIKTSFHKIILKIINDDIQEKCKDKKAPLFKNLPQEFIANVNMKENLKYFDYKFEDLLFNWKNENNEKTRLFLLENPSVSERLKWNQIKEMKYKELLEEFFLSAEFEKSIIDMKNKYEKKNKKLTTDYLENYINMALNYIDFFINSEIKDKKQIKKPQKPQTSEINSFVPNDYYELRYFTFCGNKERINTFYNINEEPMATFRDFPSLANFSSQLDDESSMIIEDDSKEDLKDDNISNNINIEKNDSENLKRSIRNIINENDKKFL